MYSVVLTWHTPPPRPYTNLPPSIILARLNPFSAVRAPTRPLNENVPPGGRTQPLIFAQASFMFETRGMFCPSK